MVRPKGLIFLILLMTSFCLYSPGAEEVVTQVEFQGLKRTKPAAVMRHMRPFLGRPAESILPTEVYAAVLDTGILEPLSYTIEGGVLRVEVREKWSFFPLPIIAISSSRTSYGGFLIDTNAFGLTDKFFLGGMYNGGSNWMAMASYSHTPLQEGFPGWGLSGRFARQERKDADQKNNTFRRADIQAFGGSLGLSYPLANIFHASLIFSYEDVRRQNSDFPGPETLRQGTIAAGFGARTVEWDGFFLSERSVGVGYGYTLGTESFQTIRASGVFEMPLFPSFRLRLKAGAVHGIETPAFFEYSPKEARVDILPGSFKAHTLAGLSGGIEQFLYRFSFGILSIQASYQGVWSWSPALGNSLDHGVAGLLSVYLSRLAVPALGLGLCYNVEADYLQFAFNMGMSF